MTTHQITFSFSENLPWEAIFSIFDQEGLVIIENVLEEADVQRFRSLFQPYLELDQRGRNDFEGQKTNRVYSVLKKIPEFAEIVSHPLVMKFCERDLGAECLLSSCLAINLLPGETPQPWHFDDAHLTIPRPRDSYGVSAFWLLDDTDELNGATEFIPRSHKWGNRTPDDAVNEKDFKKRQDKSYVATDSDFKTLRTCATAGSVVIAKGTIWHRGTANQSDQPRLIVTPQYCPGWARQLENLMLSTPIDVVKNLPSRAQELLGYSIHPPFMGYVDGEHPKKLL